MTSYESYHAVADPSRAKLLADTTSPFTIEVRFLGGLTEQQRAAFTAAADRWATMIVGDLPSVTADGETIDDVLILAQGSADRWSGRCARSGRSHHSPAGLGRRRCAAAGQGRDVLRHRGPRTDAGGRHARRRDHPRDGSRAGDRHDLAEQGPAAGASGSNPTFSGPRAMAEYAALLDVDAHDPCRWRTPAASGPEAGTGARRCSGTS